MSNAQHISAEIHKCELLAETIRDIAAIVNDLDKRDKSLIRVRDDKSVMVTKDQSQPFVDAFVSLKKHYAEQLEAQKLRVKKMVDIYM